MNTDILDKFTTHLRNALAKAYTLAVELSSSGIHPEHLMLALLMQKGSVGGEMLRQSNLSAEELRRMLHAVNQFSPKEAVETPRLSAESKRVIEKAVLTANTHRHKYVGTEHLLSGVLEIDSPVVDAILTDQEIDTIALREQVATTLKSTTKFPEITETFEGGKVPKEKDEAAQSLEQALAPATMETTGGKTPALDFFAVDLTDPKAQENIDPVIGRDDEIGRLIQVLCRRTKNNPVLLGEPGVGKTAIIEGLAKRIAEGDVPEILAEKRIMSLDLGLIIAGTIYRGEFEGRLKQITDEAKADPDIILFIDELHNIMGAGATNGSMDAANLLKPALARGTLRCIGATTIAEFKKHIESDGALERRFQQITVDEPSIEDAIGIMKGIRKNYETFHDVKITDDALEASVTLSDRYITDRRLPDKAIDLLDEAASRVRVAQSGEASKKRTTRLEAELEKLRDKKLDAVHGENFIEALELKHEEERLTEELKKATSGKQKTGSGKKKKGTNKITRKEIAAVVAQATGIALDDLVMEEKARLLNLEDRLQKHIVGQDDAVTAVAEMVRRAKAGIADPNRPLASFIFLGPSGVGKTELAKVLAEEVFKDPNAMVRIDMSEFAEGFNMSKLVGAPAGYVGYREETKLTDMVKRRPHSLVLFDEIEKAHPDVHNLLLQILEDGHITDATGRKINFKNAIIVMTSNVGAEALKTAGIGFTSDKKGAEVEHSSEAISGALENAFRPEFLNRIDKTVFFRPLSKEDLKEIVTLQLDELSTRLSEDHDIKLKTGNGTVDLIAEKSWNPLFGARAVRRQIQELIEAPLAKALLGDEYRKKSTVTVTAADGELKLTSAAQRARSKAAPLSAKAKGDKKPAKTKAYAGKAKK
ncbi:MAG: ATP-dependent Clp protease ATP-binding subunit [Patescibacteria group bacterium]|nr:ATP-dependent Clp protease ATP-binding subunit [Patescibacteria group bacterium]